ncbi:MAG: ABC transporter ATP-binding protein [Hungatella sp.]|jgi:ATP-binding cassette subfamily B multidrug efflux pump|nr:ABC transporter ATP-binding protein [Hungatella sp.]MCI9635518.1 ABC transporter ATP-binding protein [Hungatella sp.]
MRKLLKYFKGYKLESVMGPLFKLLEASFELFVPLVMAQIIDVGINNRDMGHILRMGGVLVLLGVVGLTCSLTAQYFSAKAAVGIGTLLRNDLFRHINTLSYREIDTIGTSTLVTRMTSDINQVQSGINLVLRLFLRSPFIVFGAMIMAFTINVRAALVFVVTIPLLSIVVFGVMLVSMPLYKKVQRQLDQVLLTTRENLLGARVVRAFNRQQDEIHKFDQENDLLVGIQVFVGKISALMNPVTYVIVNGAIIVLVWTGAWQVEGGVISQGQVVALVNYMSQILVELVKLANLIITISKALACANRINGVFAEHTSIVEKAAAGGETGKEKGTLEGEGAEPGGEAAKVEFKDMDFYYAKAKEPSLSGLSFQVKKGQTIGIIGGTGSGKSSLVNLIPRFYDATKGAVLVDGKDVKDYSLSGLREKVGVVPQKAVLFKGSLRENMRWGKTDATDQEIYKALDTAQAREFVDTKGQGLDLMIEQGGKNLSGGQRQRLTIARALVRNPEILIMDDSASALDFATDAALRKAIKENTGDMTVFLVSQRATTIKNADQILVLDDGKLVGLGTHKELLDQCEVYREICLSQLSEKEARQ